MNTGFIAWDGEETRDAGYCLFGASINGLPPDRLTTACHPDLSTRECLDLLLNVAEMFPGFWHVAYSFDYDVNWILRELSWPELITLKVKGKVNWDGYVISHVPHKIFKVEHDGIQVRIDDVFSFFRCRYDKALQKYKIGEQGVRDQITRGKDNRADFFYADIAEIREYWSLELQTMCDLMLHVKSMADSAGFSKLNQWHGPGALAAYSLREHNTEIHMKKSPPVILNRALTAYAGGWFERFQCGYHRGWCATADLNAAYVWAMSLLPDLARGTWTYTTSDLDTRAKECRFGLFRVKWRADHAAYMRACHGIPFPLFHRDADGSVRRPLVSDVWLWNPEAANCTASPYAELTEAWIFNDDGSYPFAWVGDMYANRLDLQSRGDPAEKILKWAMASYYGRLAQRTGWNEHSRTPPRFHQIEWAGWITSLCRATIYRAAFNAGISGGLVSVDTDGIISTVPFDIPDTDIGSGLGQWKIEEYDGLIYIQNGVYWLRKNGNWEDPKLRGIPHTRMSSDIAIRSLQENGTIRLSRHSFRGYSAAIRGRRDQWRTWQDDEITISAASAGARIHNEQSCRACQQRLGLDETLHDLMLVPNRQVKSKPHSLPWVSSNDTDKKLAALLAKEDLTEYMLWYTRLSTVYSERDSDGKDQGTHVTRYTGNPSRSDRKFCQDSQAST